MTRFSPSPRACAFAAFALAVALAPQVRAGSMDPAPERLQVPYTDEQLTAAGLPAELQGKGDVACQVVAANPSVYTDGSGKPIALPCRADTKAFAALAGEYGYAIAPGILRGAHTYGQKSFELRFQASIATINNGESYWKLGTEGPRDAAKNQASVQNKDPDPVVQLYGVEARKGLPFGFETGAFFGWIAQSSLFVPGVSVRWVPKEGFRDDVIGLLPDISFGAAFRTITGTTKMSVYTTALDVEVSKRITVASALEFTPYLAMQRLIVAGRSSALDLTPNVDANAQCGFSGYDASRNKICSNRVNGYTLVNDFNNTTTFDTTVTHRTRTIGGVQIKRDHFVMAGEVAFDLTDPGSENANLTAGRQLTFALSTGASF